MLADHKTTVQSHSTLTDPRGQFTHRKKRVPLTILGVHLSSSRRQVSRGEKRAHREQMPLESLQETDESYTTQLGLPGTRRPPVCLVPQSSQNSLRWLVRAK